MLKHSESMEGITLDAQISDDMVRQSRRSVRDIVSEQNPMVLGDKAAVSRDPAGGSVSHERGTAQNRRMNTVCKQHVGI